MRQFLASPTTLPTNRRRHQLRFASVMESGNQTVPSHNSNSNSNSNNYACSKNVLASKSSDGDVGSNATSIAANDHALAVVYPVEGKESNDAGGNCHLSDKDDNCESGSHRIRDPGYPASVTSGRDHTCHGATDAHSRSKDRAERRAGGGFATVVGSLSLSGANTPPPTAAVKRGEEEEEEREAGSAEAVDTRGFVTPMLAAQPSSPASDGWRKGLHATQSCGEMDMPGEDAPKDGGIPACAQLTLSQTERSRVRSLHASYARELGEANRAGDAAEAVKWRLFHGALMKLLGKLDDSTTNPAERLTNLSRCLSASTAVEVGAAGHAERGVDDAEPRAWKQQRSQLLRPLTMEEALRLAAHVKFIKAAARFGQEHGKASRKSKDSFSPAPSPPQAPELRGSAFMTISSGVAQSPRLRQRNSLGVSPPHAVNTLSRLPPTVPPPRAPPRPGRRLRSPPDPRCPPLVPTDEWQQLAPAAFAELANTVHSNPDLSHSAVAGSTHANSHHNTATIAIVHFLCTARLFNLAIDLAPFHGIEIDRDLNGTMTFDEFTWMLASIFSGAPKSVRVNVLPAKPCHARGELPVGAPCSPSGSPILRPVLSPFTNANTVFLDNAEDNASFLTRSVSLRESHTLSRAPSFVSSTSNGKGRSPSPHAADDSYPVTSPTSAVTLLCRLLRRAAKAAQQQQQHREHTRRRPQPALRHLHKTGQHGTPTQEAVLFPSPPPPRPVSRVTQEEEARGEKVEMDSSLLRPAKLRGRPCSHDTIEQQQQQQQQWPTSPSPAAASTTRSVRSHRLHSLMHLSPYYTPGRGNLGGAGDAVAGGRGTWRQSLPLSGGIPAQDGHAQAQATALPHTPRRPPLQKEALRRTTWPCDTDREAHHTRTVSKRDNYRRPSAGSAKEEAEQAAGRSSRAAVLLLRTRQRRSQSARPHHGPVCSATTKATVRAPAPPRRQTANSTPHGREWTEGLTTLARPRGGSANREEKLQRVSQWTLMTSLQALYLRRAAIEQTLTTHSEGTQNLSSHEVAASEHALHDTNRQIELHLIALASRNHPDLVRAALADALRRRHGDHTTMEEETRNGSSFLTTTADTMQHKSSSQKGSHITNKVSGSTTTGTVTGTSTGMTDSLGHIVQTSHTRTEATSVHTTTITTTASGSRTGSSTLTQLASHTLHEKAASPTTDATTTTPAAAAVGRLHVPRPPARRTEPQHQKLSSLRAANHLGESRGEASCESSNQPLRSSRRSSSAHKQTESCQTEVFAGRGGEPGEAPPPDAQIRGAFVRASPSEDPQAPRPLRSGGARAAGHVPSASACAIGDGQNPPQPGPLLSPARTVNDAASGFAAALASVLDEVVLLNLASLLAPAMQEANSLTSVTEKPKPGSPTLASRSSHTSTASAAINPPSHISNDHTDGGSGSGETHHGSDALRHAQHLSRPVQSTAAPLSRAGSSSFRVPRSPAGVSGPPSLSSRKSPPSAHQQHHQPLLLRRTASGKRDERSRRDDDDDGECPETAVKGQSAEGGGGGAGADKNAADADAGLVDDSPCPLANEFLNKIIRAAAARQRLRERSSGGSEETSEGAAASASAGVSECAFLHPTSRLALDATQRPGRANSRGSFIGSASPGLAASWNGSSNANKSAGVPNIDVLELIAEISHPGSSLCSGTLLPLGKYSTSWGYAWPLRALCTSSSNMSQHMRRTRDGNGVPTPSVSFVPRGNSSFFSLDMGGRVPSPSAASTGASTYLFSADAILGSLRAGGGGHATPHALSLLLSCSFTRSLNPSHTSFGGASSTGSNDAPLQTVGKGRRAPSLLRSVPGAVRANPSAPSATTATAAGEASSQQASSRDATPPLSPGQQQLPTANDAASSTYGGNDEALLFSMSPTSSNIMDFPALPDDDAVASIMTPPLDLLLLSGTTVHATDPASPSCNHSGATTTPGFLGASGSRSLTDRARNPAAVQLASLLE